MSLLIGSGEGVFKLDGTGSPRPIDGLEGRTIRVFCQSNGSLLAGADNGVFRSTDGGRSWRLSGHKRVPPPPAMISAYVWFIGSICFH